MSRCGQLPLGCAPAISPNDELWTADNRRSDTLGAAPITPSISLWTADNRRSDTLARRHYRKRQAVDCGQPPLRYTFCAARDHPTMLWTADNRRSDTLTSRSPRFRSSCGLRTTAAQIHLNRVVQVAVVAVDCGQPPLRYTDVLAACDIHWAVDCGQPPLRYTTGNVHVPCPQLWTADNRRSDTLLAGWPTCSERLWTADNRRSDTLAHATGSVHSGLWTADNRRSDTLQPARCRQTPPLWTADNRRSDTLEAFQVIFPQGFTARLIVRKEAIAREEIPDFPFFCQKRQPFSQTECR
jgi:hypothetical protein